MAGCPALGQWQGLPINASASVVQAAIDGQGVALGRSVLVADELAAGRLVRPFAGFAIDLPRAWCSCTERSCP